MAEKSTIARPYAKALFALWREHKTAELASWSELLEAAALVAADERVAKLLNSPHVSASQLAELFNDVLAAAIGQPALVEEARDFIRVLAANRRLGYLPEIADRFARLRAELENTVEVTVTSATPLNEAQRQQYAQALSQRLRREVRLHYAVDSKLLGGAILKANDLVIDGSLRGRLERLRTQMAA